MPSDSNKIGGEKKLCGCCKEYQTSNIKCSSRTRPQVTGFGPILQFFKKYCCCLPPEPSFIIKPCSCSEERRQQRKSSNHKNKKDETRQQKKKAVNTNYDNSDDVDNDDGSCAEDKAITKKGSKTASKTSSNTSRKSRKTTSKIGTRTSSNQGKKTKARKGSNTSTRTKHNNNDEMWKDEPVCEEDETAKRKNSKLTESSCSKPAEKRQNQTAMKKKDNVENCDNKSKTKINQNSNISPKTR